MNEPRATIDFETRSPVSLPDCGAYVYSLSEATEAMVLRYHLPEWPKSREPGIWHMAHPQYGIEETPPPEDLFWHIQMGGLVEAHNAFFERCIWTNVMVRRRGWQPILPRQWRCSAAKASAHSLPRGLEDAVKALRLPIEKDMEGRKLMLRLSKPRKARKAEIKAFMSQGMTEEEARQVILWREDEADIRGNWAYCGRDVQAEMGLSEALPDLSPEEQEVWFMDQEVNWRGVRIDREMVNGALSIAGQAVDRLNAELFALTGVEKGTKRQQVREWLSVHEGVHLSDTTGDVVDYHLSKPDLSPRARRVLTILRQVNRTSTKKYVAMLDRMSPEDDRVRDTMMYHGANTGRWSGKGIQPHNFPRGTIKKAKGTAPDVDVWEEVARTIKTGDLDWVEALYGDPMELLSSALRGAICASEGRELVTVDFAAIEARVVLWMAGAISALDVFRRGEDIYLDLAMRIYERSLTKADANERQMGKQGILGLGFGMGAPKFQVTVAGYGMEVSLDFAKRVVKLYREAYPEVPRFWKGLENAAILACQNPGNVATFRGIKYRRRGQFLKCKLPSGRLLTYVDPALIMKPTPWGEERPALTYMEVDAKTKQWVRTDTYGGKLTENVVQATARDFLSEGMMRVRRHGTYDMVLSVHDENVAEKDKGVGSLREFEDLMSEVPAWGAGCPIGVEGWCAERYRK